MYVYNFPATVFVPGCWVDRVRQADKVAAEAAEAQEAAVVMECGRHYVMELLDVIHAAETALREFDKGLVDECAARVHDKNSLRGYYGEPRVLMLRDSLEGGCECAT